ncbi:hypothetical protein GCM10010433_62570 [Streptomyces pulveraceus]
MDLGRLQLTRMAFPNLRSQRTTQLIRRADPETYELTLILGGSMWVRQGRSETDLAAGDFAIWSSSRPYQGRAASGPVMGTSRALILHLPRALVPLPEAKVDQMAAHALPARSGMGRILARYLTSLSEEGQTLDARDSNRLETTSLDLATGFLAHAAGAQSHVPPETRHQILLARIDTFIQDNLADPALTPGAVAARHHISLRLLQHLFRDRGESVAASIRRRRLEHCHADLAAAHLRHASVQTIAAQWGLTSASGFSRMFRAAYGVTPGEHRHTSLMGGESTVPGGQGRGTPRDAGDDHGVA